MLVEHVLMEELNQFATQIRGRATGLRQELRDIEARATDIRAQLKTIDLSIDRERTFEPRAGNFYQCPRCYLKHGTQAPLRAVSAPDPQSADLFRCNLCPSEYLVPIDR